MDLSPASMINPPGAIWLIFTERGQRNYLNDKFDFLICTSSFKNFSEPLKALNEMHRLLKPGTKAWISGLRRDVSNEIIDSFVHDTMKVKGLAGIFMKYTFKHMLKPRALTEGESWRAMASMVGHWQLRRYGTYALENKVDHRVLGIAGLDYPIDWLEPEIQWGLCREFWGKGYASEAVRAVKKMAAQHLPDLSHISLIHPDNANSINLAKAVCAHFENEYDFRGGKWYIYRHKY